jgi:PAS domain S-box-containing protein
MNKQKKELGEMEYKAIVESLSEVIMVTKLDGIVSYLTPNCKKLFGYSQEELVGTIPNIVFPEDNKWVQEKLQEVLKGSVGKIIQYRIVTKDKKIKWIRHSWNPTFVDGKLKEAISILSDIAERKKAEEKMEKNLNILNETGEMAKIGGWELNIATGVAIWTDETYNIFGIDVAKEGPKLPEGLSFYPPKDRPIIAKAVDRAIKYGEPYDLEIGFIDKKGDHKWVHTNGKANYEGKKIVSVSGTIQDITERKKAEEELKQSEKKYRTITETIPGAVYKCDIDWTFLFVSSGIKELTGFPATDFINNKVRSYMSLMFEEDMKRITPSLDEALKRKDQLYFSEYRLKNKDGRIKWVRDSVRILYDKKSKAIGYEGVLLDVTEKKKAEKELMDLNQSLEERVEERTKNLEKSNRLKDLFMDIMRHDLLNPAGVVKMNSQLALSEEKDIRKRKILEPIERNSNRMIRMIENASILARLESEEKIEFTEEDIGIMLKGSIEELNEKAKEKGMEIKTVIKGKFPAQVNPLIQNIFSNFLSNAIKYCPEKTEMIAGIKEKGDDWLVYVEDRGDAIPTKYKKTIFDRFTRLEKGAIKGSGLGLAISKKIIEVHNGEIGVKDHKGGGSVFYVLVPKVHVEVKTAVEPTTKKIAKSVAKKAVIK